jgi:hypothetical protein
LLTATIGGRLLTDLGFLHVPGLPGADGPAYLFVALRRTPTLRHFDPERVDLWFPENGRGTRGAIDIATPSGRREFAWGTIRVVDRKRVANEFASFGGLLEARRFDDVLVAVLSSDAPIVARGGHSQGRDQAADEMAAFFARLRAAIGQDPALEKLVCSLPPLALYSAFLADTIERHRDGHGEVVGDLTIVRLVTREAARLRLNDPADWHRGAPLAAAVR